MRKAVDDLRRLAHLCDGGRYNGLMGEAAVNRFLNLGTSASEHIYNALEASGLY
jgi:hypothetical protein